MHLPSHAVLNLTALDQWATPEDRPFVLLGAILPDLPVLAFYFICRFFFGFSDDKIWKDLYYRDRWFNLFATFHSIPVTAGLCLLGVGLGVNWLALLGASMLLHNIVDLPIHANDAHRHFFPITNYRFKSPISYWNPRFWGRIVAAAELVLLMVCSFYLFPMLVTWWAKAVVVVANLIFVVCYGAFYLAGYGKELFQSMAPD